MNVATFNISSSLIFAIDRHSSFTENPRAPTIVPACSLEPLASNDFSKCTTVVDFHLTVRVACAVHKVVLRDVDNLRAVDVLVDEGDNVRKSGVRVAKGVRMIRTKKAWLPQGTKEHLYRIDEQVRDNLALKGVAVRLQGKDWSRAFSPDNRLVRLGWSLPQGHILREQTVRNRRLRSPTSKKADWAIKIPAKPDKGNNEETKGSPEARKHWGGGMPKMENLDPEKCKMSNSTQ
ncbi:hypothetical protein CYMTET_8730 [Cymbomonas tetramitiformis]|uniref:Uncharacterized protein n=1 Tax=Cymbomonas tetramitiformis TaxID=36881 RepID=A0AAE0GT65_9CHLO|nr:hypothetical protein CYMTET_8730 [Cymbomonas tetramitiformis]